MSHYQKGKLFIHINDGSTHETPALLNPYFAIHKDVSQTGYMVSHRLTGCAIHHFEKQANAKRCAEQLTTLCGDKWNFTASDQFTLWSRDTVQAVQRVCQEAEDGR